MLTEIESVDWQSLTFTGERHVIRLRVPGPNAEDVLRALTEGLGEAEFAVAGHVVADIALAGQPGRAADGSYTVAIEALTIAD